MIKQDSLQADNGAVQSGFQKVASRSAVSDPTMGPVGQKGADPVKRVTSKWPSNESGSSAESSMTTKSQQWVICQCGQYVGQLWATTMFDSSYYLSQTWQICVPNWFIAKSGNNSFSALLRITFIATSGNCDLSQ